MNKVTVTIQGSNYTMVGDKTDKEILRVANYVDQEMNKLSSNAPSLSSLQVSILTSLNLADLLFECSNENEAFIKEIEELKLQLSKPSEEMEAKINELLDTIKSKEAEIIENKSEIERLNSIIADQQAQIDNLSNVTECSKSEIETYKEQMESLKVQLEDVTKRAETAEQLSSEWQNKSFNLQLAITELEDKLKTEGVIGGIVPAE